MARTRKVETKTVIDQMLDQIDLHGLTQEEVLGQNGLLKQLTGKLLNKILEAEMERTKVRHTLGMKNTPTQETTPGTAGTVTAKRQF